MSDIERVATAMHQANAELEVNPPDVTETVGHARRSLIRRLLVIGVLSAIGATLLIVGGTAPAIIHIRATRSASNDHEHQQGGSGGGEGGETSGNGGKGGHHPKKSGGEGGHHKHHGEYEAAVGPGEPISKELPDLVVSHLTKTKVTVANHSQASSEPFVVNVTVEAEGQNPLIRTVSSKEGLEAGGEETLTFELPCESGTIIAEVDPANEIEESSEEDNVSTETPPVKCEPAEDEEEEEAEKGKAKETSGSGSTTGTVDAATGASGGATAP